MELQQIIKKVEIKETTAWGFKYDVRILESKDCGETWIYYGVGQFANSYEEALQLKSEFEKEFEQ